MSTMLDSQSSWVIDVNEQNFETDVLARSAQVPIVLDFWSSTCQPCKVLTPKLEKLARERKGAFILAKVNVDEAQRVAAAFRIRAVPTVFAVVDKQVMPAFEGVPSDEELEEFINQIAPGGPETLVKEALASESKDLGKAEELYREALKGDEKFAPAKVGLARVLIQQGKLADAEQLLVGLPRTGQLGSEATRLGKLLASKKSQPVSSEESELRQKISQEANNARLHFQLGDLLGKNERYPDALAALMTAAELDIELARNEVRERMLQIFERIGMRSELADQYRARLQMLLY